jgi:hypothetical protein
MALDRTFLAMTPKRLASAIMQARRRVVYAAPSLSLDVAAALVNVHGRLDTVAVVVDASEGVFRLGYGVADALATLKEKRIAIRDQTVPLKRQDVPSEGCPVHDHIRAKRVDCYRAQPPQPS